MDSLKFKQVATWRQYAYYVATDNQGLMVYAIDLLTCTPPQTGLYNPSYLCRVRGVPNKFERFDVE